MKTSVLTLIGLLLSVPALGIVGCADHASSVGLDSGDGQDSTAGTDTGDNRSDAKTGGDSTAGSDGSGGSDGSTGRDGSSGDGASSDGGDAGTASDAGAVACDRTARPACTAASANCLLIDDFDALTDAGLVPVPPMLPPNEAGITGQWVVSADSTDGGVTLPNPFRASAGGAGDAGDPYAMWFFSSGHPIYSDFEISFQATWNASAYSGIQFWAKKDAVDGGSTVAPRFSFKTVPAGFSFGTQLAALTTDWQLVYVPFCSLVGTADAGAVDPSQFSGLAFTLGNPLGIWIDQVYLVK